MTNGPTSPVPSRTRTGKRGTLPRCMGAAKSPIRLEPIRGESRCPINHPGLQITNVRRHILAVGANRISGITQVNGLSPVQRADRGQRCPQRSNPRISEDGDRGNVVSHLGWHRRGDEAAKNCLGGDQVYHHCALGIPTEHQPGVGTVRSHRLDVSVRIRGASGCRPGEIFRGGVVDGIHPDGPSPNL